MNTKRQKPKTSKYEEIYSIVRKIPKGYVATYGQIARLITGCTPRMVGYALHALRQHKNVPWQRVINSRGEISLRKTDGGNLLQKEILISEGVEFDNDDRVDLNQFRWKVF